MARYSVERATLAVLAACAMVCRVIVWICSGKTGLRRSKTTVCLCSDARSCASYQPQMGEHATVSRLLALWAHLAPPLRLTVSGSVPAMPANTPDEVICALGLDELGEALVAPIAC